MTERRPVGWYDDPLDSGRRRFWDGSSWLLPDDSGRLVRVGDRAWDAFCFASNNQLRLLATGFGRFAAWFWSPVPAADRSAAASAHLSLLMVFRPLQLRRRKDSSEFVHRHATEAANFQITALLATWTPLVITVILLLTIPVNARAWVMLPTCAFIVVGTTAEAWMCQAVVRALKGEPWRYPICLRPIGRRPQPRAVS